MKKYLILVLIVLLIGTLSVGVLAGKTGQAGKSNIAHLYLYEKTGEPDWVIVEGGAWGKMQYNLSGVEFEFVFNGHGLVPGEAYSLIYYPDPWPPSSIIVLGTGTANNGGEVHIAGSCETNMDLPNCEDTNNGAKIWLVLSEDVGDGDDWEGSWNFAEYLFEENLITFDDTDEEPCP
jgi:hypothetical protein